MSDSAAPEAELSQTQTDPEPARVESNAASEDAPATEDSGTAAPAEPSGDVADDDEDMPQVRKSRLKKGAADSDDEETSKPRRSKFVDDEAEGSGDEADHQEEQDGEGEDGDGDAAAEDEDEEAAEKPRRKKLVKGEGKDEESEEKKKKKRRKRHEKLAEDDLLLIEENTGRRIARDIDEDVEPDDDDEDETNARRRLKKQKGATGDGDRVLLPSASLPDLSDSEDEHLYDRPNEEDKVFVDDDFRDDDAFDDDAEYRRVDEADSVRRARDIFGNIDIADIFQGDFAVAAGAGYDRDRDEYDEAEDRVRPRVVSLQDMQQILEPAVLEARHLTQKDEDIRNLDIPERMQPRFAARDGAVTEEDIQSEAKWLMTELFPTRSSPDLASKIEAVLRFMNVEHLEVPFIQTYRRDYIQDKNPHNSLSAAELWKIDEFDDKWARLAQRKKKLLEGIQRLRAPDEDLIPFIRDASSAVELDDAFSYIRLLATHQAATAPAPSAPVSMDTDSQDDASQPAGEAAAGAGGSQQKKPKAKQSTRSSSFAADLEKLSDKLGLPPAQYARNAELGYLVNRPVEYAEGELENDARSLINQQMPSVDAVLAEARSLAAEKLGTHMAVRKVFRKMFLNHAAVSTEPTHKGLREIDWLHEYYPVKRLRRKPARLMLKSMGGEGYNLTQFLLILKAEREGFIKHTITVVNSEFIDPPSTSSAPASSSPVEEKLVEMFVTEQLQFYESRNVSTSAKWLNEQRRRILTEAFRKHLLPAARSYVKDRLTQEAHEQVTVKCCEVLDFMLRKGPFRSQREPDQTPRRLVGCVLGDDKTPTAFVCVNEFGDVIDHLSLHFIRARPITGGRKGEEELADAVRFGRELSVKRQEDYDRLSAFVKLHVPSLIAIGAVPNGAREFREDIAKRLTDLTAANDIEIQLVDPEVARIYRNSERATAEFKEYSPNLREAVSLARFNLDPATEVCGLWTGNTSPEALIGNATGGANDVLSLKLSDLQNEVPKATLLRALQRTFASVINELGVDINAIVTRPFASSPLQFICGLGPRKAQRLIDLIQRSTGFVFCRDDIRKLLIAPEADPESTPIVYRNCAGFIKVLGHRRESNRMTLLDSTRIHPDHYSYARQVVWDALDQAETEDLRAFEEHLQEAMSQEGLRKIDTLDLDAFAQMEADAGHGKVLTILKMIRDELNHPFSDYHVRSKFAAPSQSQMFTLCTGESESTLRIGQLVNCTILRTIRDGVLVRLDNGLKGKILTADFSDTIRAMQHPRDMSDALKERAVEGMNMNARVLRIDVDSFEVQLTSRSSDLRDTVTFERRTETDDPYLVKGPTPEDLAREKEQQEKKDQKRYLPRSIIHPLFRNCSSQEACLFLADKPDGEVLIRPSTRGTQFLVFTWKVAPKVFWHVEVEEKEKSNPDALGRKLVIGKLPPYEDLDDIISNYFAKMNDLVQSVLKHNKFRFGAQSVITQMLRDEKGDNPSRAPYFFHLGENGNLYLSFMPHQSVHTEAIVVKPDGLSFRGKTCQNADQVIKILKTSRSSGSSASAGGSSGSGSRPMPGRPAPGPDPRDRARGYPPPPPGPFFPGAAPPPVPYGMPPMRPMPGYGGPAPYPPGPGPAFDPYSHRPQAPAGYPYAPPPMHYGGPAHPPMMPREGDRVRARDLDGRMSDAVVRRVLATGQIEVEYGGSRRTAVLGPHEIQTR